jgi:hypothetical protein
MTTPFAIALVAYATVGQSRIAQFVVIFEQALVSCRRQSARYASSPHIPSEEQYS